jgi:hypothetical protein
MVLVADPEYRSICERIGLAATRDQFNDPERRPDPTDLSWMEGFTSALRNGVFPDPTVIAHISNCFSRYLLPDVKGKFLSLDEAFDLKPRQRAGTPAAGAAKRQQRDRYCHEMFAYLERRKDQGSALDAAQYAITVLDLTPPNGADIETMLETMVRNYSAWRKSLPQVAKKRAPRRKKKQIAKKKALPHKKKQKTKRK